MRYEIIICFKGSNGSTAYPAKSLQQVNEFLLECIDETVHSVEVRDRILKSLVTWIPGRKYRISKATFVESALPKPTRRKNLARYL